MGKLLKYFSYAVKIVGQVVATAQEIMNWEAKLQHAVNSDTPVSVSPKDAAGLLRVFRPVFDLARKVGLLRVSA